MNVLCGACGAPADSLTCGQCGSDVRLQGRYTLESIVGQGAAGVTYRARDAEGEVVAVKEMPLRHTDPDLAKRVAREARVQGELHHDCIPRYVEHFTQGTGKQQVFYLVQGFIDGPTLAGEMERRRYSEDEVLAILDELCGILEYLHGLMPPVVHRDIKLKNIIRRSSDQKLVLIDFGAVHDVVTDPRSGGSTVAGTYGYMAPEQYRGDASPQSDLYALGVLGVVLLSRRDPLDMVRPDHSLDWRTYVQASAGTSDLVDALLAPEPRQRPASALEVRQRIGRIRQGPQRAAPAHRFELAPASPTLPVVVRRPTSSRSRSAAIALAFLGSPFGVHWWYLDRPVLALLSAVFCFTGLPTLVSIFFGFSLIFGGQRSFDLRYNPQLTDFEDGRTAQLARQVEALHTLYMKGALSQAEFEREKLRLLGSGLVGVPALLAQIHQGGLFQTLKQLRDLPRLLQDELRREFKGPGRNRRRGPPDPPDA